MADDKPGFWSTLPGILTGAAALIASMTGLYAVFSRPPASPAAAPASPTAGLSNTPAAPAADGQPAAAQLRPAATAGAEVKATIVDPDGWTNLRAGPSRASAVVGRINQGDIFWTRPRDGLWWPARTDGGLKGYVHRSRVRLNP
jgi:hypothetical protein